MFIELTAAQAALREEVRGYFARLMSPGERAELLTERHGAAYRDIVRRMGRDGWLGVGWPTKYGGRGFGQVEQQIFVSEAARADVPLPAVTLQTVGPTLQSHGTPGQKAFFLPKILAGEVHFAIGYTEPEAGTDLAALRTRAVRDGDVYVVNGEKIFTTGAHDADYIWLACRTNPGAAERIRAVAEQVAAAGESGARQGRDPVNLPMIRNWAEAVGDDSPVYTDAGRAAVSVHGGLVAPPAMIQVWTMPGLAGQRAGDDPLGLMSKTLDEAGYTSVVATNCDQVYHRYLRHGEQVSVRARLVDVAGPKRTALGEGWFVTTRLTWCCGGEAVAAMDFRILKFRPRPRPAPSGAVLRPQVTPDTAFFWEGTAAGELRIQRCHACGELRHPPGPMCPSCRAAQRGPGGETGYVVASGAGEVYSYVVHHHPPVPGKPLPLVIALVELAEGVRVLADMPGVDPDRVRVGMPVQIGFDRVDDDLTLPVWRPADDGRDGPRVVARPGTTEFATPESATRKPGAPRSAGQAPPESEPAAPPESLPELVIRASTTFVVASALATRDFQDVHHDRDLAVVRGSKDIFINILTSTGLVQRFLSAWAGPDAVFRSVSIRLGAPCYAGDTMTFTGQVAGRVGSEAVISVTGRCSLGDHVTGTVRVALPGAAGQGSSGRRVS